MSARPPNQLPLTEFAKKYGAYAAHTNRSGYTPVQSSFPYIGQSPFSGWDPRSWQRARLYGFTSEELAELDCLPTRELKPGNLQNYILPLLQRDRWERMPRQPDFTRTWMYPIKNTNQYWTADNDAVWNALQPPLVLASRILMSTHLMPWFDALLNGYRYPIDEGIRVQQDDLSLYGADMLESFHPDPNFQPAISNTADRDKIFSKLMNVLNLQFGFQDSDNEDPRDGTEQIGEGCYALTDTNITYMHQSSDPNKAWRVFIWLEIDMLDPLLRNDANSADRMMVQWLVANTLVHEMMHAVFLATEIPETEPSFHEPFFEEEAVSEIGGSFESVVNHGATVPAVTDIDKLPFVYFHRRKWPTIVDKGLTSNRFVLINPGVFMDDEFYPIPVSSYEDMQQDNFWELNVRKFGHGVLHYRSLTQGSAVTYTMKDAKKGAWATANTLRITGLYSPPSNDFRNGVASLQTAANMTPEDRTVMLFARRFIISSKAEDEFWTQSAQQNATANRILARIDTLMRDPNADLNAQQTLIANLVNLMSDAISNHEVMIAAIVSSETASNTRYTNRRKTLLTWNKGTRTFLNKLNLMAVSALGNFDQQFMDLERARMVLWDTHDPGYGLPSDEAEMNTLFLAISQAQAGQINDCLTTCQSFNIGVLETVSPTSSIAATLLSFQVQQNDPNDWQSRKRDLRSAIPLLDYLLAAAPLAWRTFLDQLKQISTNLLAVPQPPGAT